MKTASPIQIVVAAIVSLVLLAMAASAPAQSRGVLVNGVALEDLSASAPG